MSRIQRLSPRVAEQIAAGEVIERPSSVLKELLENSLDAGATEIAVTIKDGGKSLIEVLDNGTGIQPEDLPLALERHATSKIQALDDLETLNTLGFRGEALASIGAVSNLEIISRVANESSAYAIDLDHSTRELSKPTAKTVTFGHFLGGTSGTRIRVEGLFSQIPARLKFLKSSSAELSMIREWIERLALSHPSVGFRLQNEERTVLNLRPQTSEERARSVLADGEDYPIRKIEISRDQETRLKVYWVQGLSLPNSKNLVQLVNGRVLRDRVLQHAMMQPFRQSLLPGKFPSLVAYLEISPKEMDVNVHPTKSEIRFLDPRKIFAIFDEALGMLIRTHGSGSFVAGDVPHFSTASELAIQPTNPSVASAQSFDFSNPQPASEGSSHRQPLHPALAAFRYENYLGVLFRTFLAYDLGDELGLIDQHAAHERIRYEQLKNRALRRAESSDVQDLLIPEVVKYDPIHHNALEKRISILSRLGFETEIFGPGQLLFRSIPPEWGNQELRTRLKNLVERLLDLDEQSATNEQLFLDERLFEKIASEACRSSIRAGDRLEPWAARMLLEQLSECQHPWNCPHGRPTTARVPKARFEEWFQRIV
ncbi:MAG: DNA mismatch repair endonuclease MutL [Bdellovibrionales bacterium]|nr:DNA mismatch repair endonuclease MutL [Bdellovibrionales bacterium]